MPQYITDFHHRAKDIAGRRFGRLVALGCIGSNDDGRLMWECVCDCGATAVVIGKYLRNGDTQSCGCFRDDMRSKRFETHGLSKTRVYEIWKGINKRCCNKNSIQYKKYGARGIRVCERWRNSFENFIEDMGVPPGKEYSIDRINNNEGYYPENCRWATPHEQARNTSRNRILEIDGESMTMAEWAEISPVSYTTIKSRLRYGYSPKHAVFAPLHCGKRIYEAMDDS